MELGDPGPVPDDKKRVTSLAPPPFALDMVVLELRDKNTGDTQRRDIKESLRPALSLFFFFFSNFRLCFLWVKSRALWMMQRTDG